MDTLLTPLEQYETNHAIPLGTLAKFGWKNVYHDGRPALEFRTDSGPRWRFTDGQRPKYDQHKGYQACWYGLKRAIKMNEKLDAKLLIDCNGAASTIAAQMHGLPAFSYQSGEGTKLPQERIDELKGLWQGPIYVCFDCDKAGRSGAVKRVQLYRKNGFECYALDLAVEKEGGDLADFCALHSEDTLDELICACVRLPIPDEIEAPRPRPITVTYTRDEAETIEMVEKALSVLNSSRRDTYEEWVEVGMSLTPLGLKGKDLWDAWSQNGAGYSPKAINDHWKSFKPTGHGLGALIYWADQDYGSKDWRPLKQRVTVNERLEARLDLKSPDYPPCLPVAMRGAMLTYADKRIAPVLELWLEAIDRGYIEPGENQTVRCLVYVSEKLGRRLKEHTIRQGLDLGGMLFLHDHDQPYLGNSLNSQQNDESGQAGSPDAALFLKNGDHKVLDPVKDSGGSQELDSNPCRCHGRLPEWYTLKPWFEVVDAISKLAIAPIIQDAFPVEDGTLAPIRAEFLASLGVDDAEGAQKELAARYQALIEKQPGYQQKMEAAREEYAKYLGQLSNPLCAPIPKDWHYADATEYQACCARAFVEAMGGDCQYPRRILCERLGCADQLLPTVLSRAGIRLEKKQTADLPAPSLDYIRSLKGFNKQAKGWPKRVISSLKPEQPHSLGRQDAYTWIEKELAAGASLTVQFAQSNRQVVATEGQPERHRRPKKAKPRLSLLAVRWLAFVLRILHAALDAELKPQQQKLIEDEKLPEVEYHPYLTGKDRYRKQLVLFWVFTWAVQRYIKEEKPQETYAEAWIRGLATAATPWQVDPDRALDRQTGEIVKTTPDLALNVLLGRPDDAPTPSGQQSTREHQLWKLIISRFEQFASGALLLLPPSNTAGLLAASSLSPWRWPLSPCLQKIPE